MSKFIKLILISITSITLLAACGPSEKDAQQAGFSSVVEMKDLQAKGFKTKDDYAKSLGFSDAKDMNNLLEGFTNFQAFEKFISPNIYRDLNSEDKSNLIDQVKICRLQGFSSMSECKELTALGFNTYQDYLYAHQHGFKTMDDLNKKLADDSAEKRRKEFEKSLPTVDQACGQYNKALQECAAAGNINRCIEIKYPDLTYLRSIC